MKILTDKQKREDIFYMEMAKLVSTRSHSSRKKVGAILVKDNNILALGWNGTLPGANNLCEDEDNFEHSLVIHAIQNVIARASKSGFSTDGATLYTTYSPCLFCALLTAQAGITRVVYDEMNVPSAILTLQQHGLDVSSVAKF